MKDLDNIMDYRTDNAEQDWEEGLSLCTTIESYGLFGILKRSVVDKEKLKNFLCEKHRYWEGDFGYFRDHWNYWFVTYPVMKDNPYFGILPFPAQGLLNSNSNAVKVYEKYRHCVGEK